MYQKNLNTPQYEWGVGYRQSCLWVARASRTPSLDEMVHWYI